MEPLHSKWGGRELDKIAEDQKFDTELRLACFHSMRYTFKAELGNAGVSSEISETLAGRRYGNAAAERYEKLNQNHRRLSVDGIEHSPDMLSNLLYKALSQTWKNINYPPKFSN